MLLFIIQGVMEANLKYGIIVLVFILTHLPMSSLLCGYNVESSVSVGYPAHISSYISVAIRDESN